MEEKPTKHKRRKGIQTSADILEAAARLFAIRGYAGVSMRDIASEVGIKESSLYNHFSGKEAILEALYAEFINNVPLTRPSDAEIDKLLDNMGASEIFRYILFFVGKNISGLLTDITIVIHNEKYKNQKAAEIYYEYMITEPAAYYEKLINKLIAHKKILHVDAKTFAEQYNRISLSLTEEYFLALQGYTEPKDVVRYMIKTIEFFCSVMKGKIITDGETLSGDRR